MPRVTTPKTLFFFEKPSTMRQVQRFFKSPTTVCVAAEGHLLVAKEPGEVREAWKPWRFDELPIVIDPIPLAIGKGRSGKSHKPKIEEIERALRDADRVIIATDPGREGSMIAWEVLEHLGYRGRVDRLKLGALDDLSIRRAFAAMAAEPDSGERDHASYLEALCRQYEDYHLGLNGTRAVSLRLRPTGFKEPWRFGGVQTPTLAILADLERRILEFLPQDYFRIVLLARTDGDAEITLWHAPKDKVLDQAVAETIRKAAAAWSGPLDVEQKDVRRPPPKLFSTDTLARRCAKRFGWDPQRTAKLAQELYDQGYLSYPRTESEYLPESQANDAGAILDSIVAVLTDLAPVVAAAGDPIIRKGQKGHYIKDPGEHHAIVPLRKVPAPGAVGADHFRLWELVAQSFIAAHLPDGIDARTRVAVLVDTSLGPKSFSVSGSVVKVPGWRAIYGTEADEEPDVVPGRAKTQEEPSAGRLPHVEDGEAARATEARIDTANTEQPRRITRGELPVVMGRLIDQVEDPALKAALANPVNPNEPKGLGTAATRDTMLPKLLKSEYVTLLKGKDPPIKVTQLGLAFMGAVQRVFPVYADPVGRALFEAQLGEIGRARTPEEARLRAAAFKDQTRARVVELIEAVGSAEIVAVEPAATSSPSSKAKQRPTKAMVTFAVSVAARKGIKLPRGLKSNGAICRAFLDKHAPAPASQPPSSPGGGPREPTEAMLRYARTLAQAPGVDLPPAVFTDFAACKAFIARHSRDGRAVPAKQRGAPTRKT